MDWSLHALIEPEDRTCFGLGLKGTTRSDRDAQRKGCVRRCQISYPVKAEHRNVGDPWVSTEARSYMIGMCRPINVQKGPFARVSRTERMAAASGGRHVSAMSAPCVKLDAIRNRVVPLALQLLSSKLSAARKDATIHMVKAGSTRGRESRPEDNNSFQGLARCMRALTLVVASMRFALVNSNWPEGHFVIFNYRIIAPFCCPKDL